MLEHTYIKNTEVSAEPSACNTYLWKMYAIEEFYSSVSVFTPGDLLIY